MPGSLQRTAPRSLFPCGESSAFGRNVQLRLHIVGFVIVQCLEVA